MESRYGGNHAMSFFKFHEGNLDTAQFGAGALVAAGGITSTDSNVGDDTFYYGILFPVFHAQYFIHPVFQNLGNGVGIVDRGTDG